MSKFNLSLVSLAVAVALTGCGGLSDDKDDSSDNHALSGHVIDPAIVGATVKMVCGSDSYDAVGSTDSTGAFSITSIPSEVDLSTCTLQATGGNDGDDFTGLTLKAPYKLFGKETGLLVTPITTLLANSDSLDTDMAAAKAEVASYLGLEVGDLLKDPTADLEVGKVSKKIVKIALVKDASGDLIGYLDTDDDGSSLDNYVSSLDVDGEKLDELETVLDAIDGAETVSDILKQALVGKTYHDLKKAYRQSYYNSAQKENLKVLAEDIVEANKKDGDYRAVTEVHIKKSLADLGIFPLFTDDEETQLDDSITEVLELSPSAFTFFKYQHNIEISELDSLIKFKTGSSEQVLGDDNDARRNYYTHSEKSNIAKMLSLTSGNYNDQVNDSINADVAFGLVNLGFYDEAINHVENTVYGEEALLESYRDLAGRFVQLGKVDEATDQLMKTFNKIKARVDKIGAENATYEVPFWLSEVIVDLNKIGKTTESEEVVEYFLDFAKNAQDNTNSIKAQVYSDLMRIIKDLSLQEARNGNLVKAKEYAKLSAEEVVHTNTEPYFGFLTVDDFAVNQAYRSAVHAELLGESDAAATAVAFAEGFDESFNLFGSTRATDWYRLKITYKALKGDVAGALVDFNNINAIGSSEDVKTVKQQALRYGLSTALYANDKEDELFAIYENAEIFSTDSDFRNLSQEIVYQNSATWGIDTPFGIRHLKGDAKLEEYLDRMYDLMEKWSITSHRDAYNIYASSYEEGYLGLVELYNSLNKANKAEEVLNSAFNKIKLITDNEYKVKGFINIFNKRVKLGLNDEDSVNELLTSLEAASVGADVVSIVKVANMHSEYGRQDKAKELLGTAHAAVVAEIAGDFDNIKERVKDLLGSGSESTEYKHTPWLEPSIAYAYFQAGDVVKAKEIIAEALASINTLEDTTQKYEQLGIVASSYALLNDVESAKGILPNIHLSTERDEALIKIASSLAKFDALSSTTVASVDSDGDGKPDFFNLDATAAEIEASGLTLDDDIDGDGIMDDSDSLPYDNVN